MAARVREGELDLIAARRPGEAGPPAGRSGSVRRAARVPKARGGARSGPQPRRLPHPDPQLGGSRGPSPVRAVRPGAGSPSRRAPVLPDGGPGLGRRRLPRPAGATGHQGRHSRPVPAHEPPVPRPGTFPSTVSQHATPGNGGLGGLKRRRRVGHPLRPIRVAVPGFFVLDGGLEMAEILHQHYLVHSHSTSVRSYSETAVRTRSGAVRIAGACDPRQG